MDQQATAPRLAQIIVAFAVAPLVAALVFVWTASLLNGPLLAGMIVSMTILFGVCGAYPLAVVLGIPAYLLLKDQVRASALSCAITGAVICALPWIILGFTTRQPITAALLLPSGAVAGVVFWAIAFRDIFGMNDKASERLSKADVSSSGPA